MSGAELEVCPGGYDVKYPLGVTAKSLEGDFVVLRSLWKKAYFVE